MASGHAVATLAETHWDTAAHCATLIAVPVHSSRGDTSTGLGLTCTPTSPPGAEVAEQLEWLVYNLSSSANCDKLESEWFIC